MPTHLNDYTTDDLRVLVRGTSYCPQDFKDKIIAVLNGRNYTGKDFLNATFDSLKTQGFPVMVCGMLVGMLAVVPKKDAQQVIEDMDEIAQAQAELERERQNRNNNDNGGAADDDKDKTVHYPNGFQVLWQRAQSEKKTRQKFKWNDKVRELAVWLFVNELGGKADAFDNQVYGEGEKENLDLMYKGKSMDLKKTFAQIKFDPAFTVTVVFDVVGGAAMETGHSREKLLFDTQRKRLPDFKNKEIKATFDKDCIMGHDDRKLRVKMPCGHVFSPSTMYSLVKMVIEKHSKVDFECPLLKCRTKWSFSSVCAAADLDKTERERFWRIIENRRSIQEAVASNKYRECQGCHALVKRPASVAMKRVRCNFCSSRSDFCWECGKDWQGGGFTYCGNEKCASNKLNKLLQECKTVVLAYQTTDESKDDASELKCPIIRACPRCFTIVRYKSDCKHMTCWGCGKKFCFMCLALQQEDNTYACGSYDDRCPIAKVQFIK